MTLGPPSLALFASLAICQATANGRPAARMVEFRDGSRLPIALAGLEFAFRPAESPGSAPLPIPLDEVVEIEFANVPPFERSREVLRLIRELASDDYARRERAVARLRQVAGGFEETLRGALKSAPDPDLAWRVLTVLRGLAPPDGGEFDVIETRDGTLRGEVSAWSTTGLYRGSALALDRSAVRAIRPRTAAESAPGFSGFTAFTSPPERVVAGVHVLDFERDGDGEPLASGQSVESAYRRLGVRFRTSYQGSRVGVVKYLVEGASGDQAAATLDPLFHGTVSARFHCPREPEIDAGVHYVSCRLAVVKRGGTSLVAYDALGDEIGRATVASGPHAFLGIASEQPIASVAIVPDPDLDADYTFDDFTFSKPRELFEAPHPDAFTLLLTDGARVVCRAFERSTEPGQRTLLTTEPTKRFPSPLRIPFRDLRSIMPPTSSRDTTPTRDDSIWALFADGSTTIVDRRGSALSVAGAMVVDLPLAALWGHGVPLQEPRAPLDVPGGGVAMILRADPEYLTDVRFEERAIVGQREDGSRVFMHYGRLPTIWFRPPVPDAVRGPSALLLVDGSLLQTGPEGVFRLEAIDGEQVHLSLRAQPESRVSIPWGRVATLDLQTLVEP